MGKYRQQQERQMYCRVWMLCIKPHKRKPRIWILTNRRNHQTSLLNLESINKLTCEDISFFCDEISSRKVGPSESRTSIRNSDGKICQTAPQRSWTTHSQIYISRSSSTYRSRDLVAASLVLKVVMPWQLFQQKDEEGPPESINSEGEGLFQNPDSGGPCSALKNEDDNWSSCCWRWWTEFAGCWWSSFNCKKSPIVAAVLASGSSSSGEDRIEGNDFKHRQLNMEE